MWGWCLSYTHHLYSYHTDATYSVNTHSPPPPLRSLTPSIHPSPFLHPPVLSSKCLSLTICILLLLLVHAGCSHSLSLKHTHRCAHTHAHASEQMSFLHMLLLIAPLLTHHLLFILRWVHTGCPRQPSIYIVIERGGDKSKGEERGRQEGPIESGSYDCSLCTASSSPTPTLYSYLFIFLLSNRVASSYLSVFILERVYKTSNKKQNWERAARFAASGACSEAQWCKTTLC